MAVSKRLRFEILRRDNHTCRYCGRSAPEVKLTVDHVVPETLGGSDDPGNLVAACADCNSGKSSMPADASLVEQVSNDAMRWASAIKEVADRRRADDAELKRWFSTAWYSSADGLLNAYDIDGRELIVNGPASLYTDIMGYPQVHTIVAPPRPRNWTATIANFVAAGLGRAEIESLVASAMASNALRENKWRYFCGCCWRAIGDLHRGAEKLIRASEVRQ